MEEQIIDTIKTSNWMPAELNRVQATKDFVFNSYWNDKYYKTKQVNPVFVEEKDEIVVVTVYVFFF